MLTDYIPAFSLVLCCLTLDHAANASSCSRVMLIADNCY